MPDGEVVPQDEEAGNRGPKQNLFLRLLLKLTKKEEEVKKKEITLDMLQPSRYKPNDLEQMAEDTKFTKREVRALYRAFKQECPNGIVDEETFKEVYEKIFPLGDASRYAHLVFCAIDRFVLQLVLQLSVKLLLMFLQTFCVSSIRNSTFFSFNLPTFAILSKL